MADTCKKKEDAKKEIRSLLLSAPVGLTLDELERDYFLFIGSKLPSAELGYESTEGFLQDIPDTVKITYRGDAVILTGVSDSSTKHIQKLVSSQKVDTHKNWGALQKPFSKSALPSQHKPPLSRKYGSTSHDSLASRSNCSSEGQDRRFEASYPARDDRRTLLSHGHQRNIRTDSLFVDNAWEKRPLSPSHSRHGGTFPVRNIQYDQQHSHSYHRPVRTSSSMMSTEPHSQNFHQQMRPVPKFIVNRIYDIVTTFPRGISLSHFANVFFKHFGFNIEYWRLGFSSLHNLLASLEDVVFLKKYSSGEILVVKNKFCTKHPVYNGPVDNHRLVPARTPEKSPVDSPANGATEAKNSQDSSHTSDIVRENAAWSENRCHTPTSQAEVAHGLSVALPDSHPSGSSMDGRPTSHISHLDMAHSLRSTHLDTSRSCPSSCLDESRDSKSHLNDVHGSILHLDEAGDSSTQFLGYAHDFTLRQPNEVNSSLHPVKAHDPSTLNLYEADNSPISQVDETCSSAYSHLPGSSTIPMMIQDNIRRVGILPADVAGPGCSLLRQQLPDFGQGSMTVGVYVSNIISPHMFWFQLRGPHTTLALECLLDQLSDLYNCKRLSQAYQVTESMIQPGMLCAAIYPEDGNWYRAVIMAVKESLLEIFFVDYGNTCCVSISNLRLLKTSFLKLPAQAIQGRLSNIKPVDGAWSITARHRFLALSRERPLCGFVTNVQDGAVSLYLTDTTQEEDVYINDVLVDEGYATFAPDIAIGDVLKPQVSDLEGSKDTSAGTGQDGVAHVATDIDTCRRYIRQVQMTDEVVVNLINLDGELYMLTSEVSSLFFGEDIISSQLSMDGVEIEKKVVTRKKCADLFQELILYDAVNVTESTNVVSLLPLTSLPQIADLYGSMGKGEEVKETVSDILQWFHPDHPYWKGVDGSPGSQSPTSAMDTCSIGTESSDALSIMGLEQALTSLEAHRNRLLNKIIVENACSPRSVDKLQVIEQHMTRVEIGITRLQSNLGLEADSQPRQISDFQEPLDQKSASELEHSQLYMQVKSTQKVAPMMQNPLPQPEAQKGPMNNTAQKLPDTVALLLQEQILLNRLLLEQLSLYQEKLVGQSPQPLSMSDSGHLPQMGNSVLNLLTPLSQSADQSQSS